MAIFQFYYFVSILAKIRVSGFGELKINNGLKSSLSAMNMQQLTNIKLCLISPLIVRLLSLKSVVLGLHLCLPKIPIRGFFHPQKLLENMDFTHLFLAAPHSSMKLCIFSSCCEYQHLFLKPLTSAAEDHCRWQSNKKCYNSVFIGGRGL